MLDFWQGLSSSYDLQILSIKWRKSRFPRVQNKTRLALRALFQCGIELLCFINRIKQPQPSPSIAAVPCRARVGFVAHLQKSQQKIRIRSLSPQQLPQLSSLASQEQEQEGSLAKGSRWASKNKVILDCCFEYGVPKMVTEGRENWSQEKGREV